MSSNSIRVSAPRDGLFMKWLREHSDTARVTIVNRNYEETEPQVVLENSPEDDDDGSSSKGAPTESSSSKPIQVTADVEEMIRSRAARLKPLKRWDVASAPKVGLSNVTSSITHNVRLRELKAQLCHYEDSTHLNSVGRFTRYYEEGYLLVKNVFGDEEGKALLAKLRSAMCQSMKHDLGVVFDDTTMEAVSESQHSTKDSNKKRKSNYDIDVTVQVIPEEEITSKDTKMVELAQKILNDHRVTNVMEDFAKGASEYHNTDYKLTRKFGWTRLRGRLMIRKEWTEYYFLKSWENDEEEMQKFDGRYARELVRRKENPKHRYAFSVWISVGPNHMDGGGLAILPGSQFLTGFLNPRKDEEVPSDFRKQIMGMPWVTDDLEPGDMLIVDIQTTRAFPLNRRIPPFVGAFADSMYTLT